MAYDAMGNFIPDTVGMTQPQQATGMPPQQSGTISAPTNIMPSGPSVGKVAGGLALGGLLSGDFNLQNILGTAGQYYGGQQGIESAYNLGQAGFDIAEQQGQRAAQQSQFRPYTVTGSLANVQTTPEGGFGIQLSPEQQALQQQLQGQAAGLFGQVGLDPAAQQQAIYEQIRATQMPEEERQRLALEERMLSQGRMGISSAAYGGSSPELLAQETARQEAMGRASLGARQQALAEQQQALAGATGLLSAGYSPQEQALNMLSLSQVPAGFVSAGQRTGAELQGKIGQSGIESLLQGGQLANQLQQQQLAAMLQAATGTQGAGGEFTGGLLGGAGGLLSSLGLGEASTPSWLKAIGDSLGFGGTYDFQQGEDPFDTSNYGGGQ